MNKIATMKSVFLIVICFSVLMIQGCQESVTEEAQSGELLTLDQKVTYIQSYKMIKKGVKNGVVFDAEVMVKAAHDAKAGLPPIIPKSENMAIMEQLRVEFEEVKRLQRVEQGKINKIEGEAFLAENAKKDDIVVTESGLQYRILKSVEGDAPKPQKDDWVKARYTGAFLDGTIFKNPTRRLDPKSFALSEVIKGWVEGFQLMKVGEKFEFFVPSELAYGDQGTASGQIGVNQVLRFEVELLAIDEKSQKDKK